jgi:hypothetical protein
MLKREANKLPCGLYILHWKSGGESMAAVGSLNNGDRWFAACDCVRATTAEVASADWHLVARAELVYLHWKSGGKSMGVVGSLNNGDRWFAACDCVRATPAEVASTDWQLVARAEPIY